MSYLFSSALFFNNFAKQLEVKFSSINDKISQVIPSTPNVDSVDLVICDPSIVSQSVATHSFSAPTPVAVRSEHTPLRAPMYCKQVAWI